MPPRHTSPQRSETGGKFGWCVQPAGGIFTKIICQSGFLAPPEAASSLRSAAVCRPQAFGDPVSPSFQRRSRHPCRGMAVREVADGYEVKAPPSATFANTERRPVSGHPYGVRGRGRQEIAKANGVPAARKVTERSDNLRGTAALWR